MNLNYVRFDVGHHFHVCHRQTLEKYPNSALTRYIAPEFDTRKTGSDYIVIDRDGKHFGDILNFMRDSSSLDLQRWDDDNLTKLSREADFYCLAELVDLCEQELANRATSSSGQSSYTVPSTQKLEIIFGLAAARKLLASVTKPTFVISQSRVKHFSIESWFGELVGFCDYDRFNVYCFADDKKSEERICEGSGLSLNLRNFIVALYEPSERGFATYVSTPTDERFRTRRSHYKLKIFKFWFMNQNDMMQALKKSSR